MITIDGFIVDAAIVEDHAHNNQVTENPTEKGSAMTDHVIVMPDRITLDCVVSNTPTAEVATARGQSNITPVQDAYQRLRRLRSAGRTVTVTTSLGVHTNMLLETLGYPRRKDDGDALHFRVTFVSADIVENERTLIKVAVPQQAKRVNRGNKPTKDATTVVPAKKKEDTSILWDLLD